MTKTIMIVDDSAALRQIVSIALTDAGYDVLEACDGKDALAKLNGVKIHLIISDVHMPIMDGITFVNEVRKLPSYKFTPVIMLSIESKEDENATGQAVGAKAWIVKPFKIEKMLAAVSRLIMP